jgi:DNA-binding SARP family transcriptional activator/tetratricopeptide (TPR) repeat protein
MRLRVLGPVEARDGDERPLPLGRVKERVLLAMLMLRANTVLSKDTIWAGLWGDQPPRSAPANVSSYVSNLRRLLAADGRPGPALETRAGGYLLIADADDLDVLAFERLVAEGREARAASRHALAVERLTQAAGLWRGQVMDGLPAPDVVRPDIARLEDLRLAAIEDGVDSRLELGQHAALVSELAALTARHEFHEGLWCRRMLALYRSGRQTEALAAYHEVAGLLKTQLGIEPGVALRALHQKILRSDPELDPPAPAGAPPVRPRQLPPAVWGFSGRAGELAWLDRVLDEMAAEATTTAALVGTAGVGKTALAVHWAHRVADRFPDGQLYADLRGHGTHEPAAPAEVLIAFLRALGVADESMPAGEPALTATYRSLLAGRRILVILDNAGSAAQVRPLLPGDPGCLTLVTSRHRLTGLVALDGVRLRAVQRLDPAETNQLLIRLLGIDRAQAEPAALAALGDLCAHLPLALRLAAARIVSTDLSIGDYVSGFGPAKTLDLLSVDDEPSPVRTMFDASYEPLNPDAQRLFRLLGLVPGHTFTPRAAAALLAVTPDRAGPVLDVLITANMVERKAADQFAMHDLLHVYAKEKTDDEGVAAVSRLLDAYLQDTETATAALGLSLVRMPHPPVGTRMPDLEIQDADSALSWLDAHRARLVAAVAHACDHGPREVSWWLCDQLRTYFWLRRCAPEWLAVGNAAVRAAMSEGDVEGEIAARHCLGDAHWNLGDYERAIRTYEPAIARFQQADLPQRHVAVLNSLGSVHRELGNLDQAHTWFRAALEMQERNGLSETGLRANIATIYEEMGRLEDALREHTRVLAVDRTPETRPAHAFSLDALGAIHGLMGRLDLAFAYNADALDLHREVGNRVGEASALENLASLHLYRDEPAQALSHATAALGIAEEIANPRVDAATLTIVAKVRLHLGDHEEAELLHRQGLSRARANRMRYLEVAALLGLASTLHATGRSGAAAEQCEEALLISGKAGFQIHEASARTLLAELAHDRGDSPAAAEQAQRAVAIHESTQCYQAWTAPWPLWSGHENRPLGSDGRSSAGDDAPLDRTGGELDQLSRLDPVDPRALEQEVVGETDQRVPDPVRQRGIVDQLLAARLGGLVQRLRERLERLAVVLGRSGDLLAPASAGEHLGLPLRGRTAEAPPQLCDLGLDLLEHARDPEAAVHLGEGAAQVVEAAFHQRREDVLLAGEVLVHGAGADARAYRDRAHGQARVALLFEDQLGGRQDVAAPALRVTPGRLLGTHGPKLTLNNVQKHIERCSVFSLRSGAWRRAMRSWPDGWRPRRAGCWSA